MGVRAVRVALVTTVATAVMVGVIGAGGAAPGDTVTAVSGGAQGLFLDFDLPEDDSEAPGPESSGSGGILAATGTTSAGDVAAQQVRVSFGPEPTVALPPGGGGPFTGSATDVVVPDPRSSFIDAASAASIDVRTEGALGATGFARSSASARDVMVAGLLASELSSSCEATSAGATGTTTVVDLAFFDDPIDVPVNPAPNTVLTRAEIPDLGSGVRIILNEQELVTDAAGSRIVVTALHIVAAPGDQPATGEAYVGRSECGVVTPEIVEPRFTG